MTSLQIRAKHWYQSARAHLDSMLLTHDRVRSWLVVLAGACFVSQLAVIGSFLDRSANSQGVVAGTDNDAGIAIGTAVGTHLYKDNGWRPYGPAYYRLARILHDVATPPPQQSSAEFSKTAMEHANERNHHFYLMWVSALSLGALALLLMTALTPDWTMRLLGATLLTGAFLRDPIWTEMIFRAHPDHLLAATMALALLLTWRSLCAPQDGTRFRLAGAGWGLVASVKMTITMLIPSFLVFLWPWDTVPGETWTARFKRTFHRGRLFAGYALFIYLVLGFPQSFAFAGVIKFLIEQSRNIVRGDFEFLKTWIGLFSNQMWRPLLMLVALAAIVPLRPELIAGAGRKAFIRLASFALLPIAFLWSRRILSPVSWYPLPFIAMLLMALVPALILAFQRVPKLERLRRSNWTPIILLLFTPLWSGSLPGTLPTVFASQQICRKESAFVEDIVNTEAAKGTHILVDPYIPYARQFHDKEIEMAWVMYPERIRPGQTTMIALHKPHYLSHFPRSEGGTEAVILHIKNLEPTRNFYRLFKGQKEVDDQFGQKWFKTHEDDCGFEIWQRKQIEARF